MLGAVMVRFPLEAAIPTVHLKKVIELGAVVCRVC